MKKIAIIVIMLLGAWSAFAGEYVVVVNKSSPLSSVSAIDLKRIYIGKMNDIDGEKVVPVNLSHDNRAASSFIQTVVGMSVAAYRSFWVAEQVRGGSAAPVLQKNSHAMIAFLLENADAIGYVSTGTPIDKLKTLTVK